MTEYIQVVTTVAQKSDAVNIAKILLEKRLAACVQIIESVESFFWWENKIDRAEEFLCVIKSRKNMYEKLEKEIKKVHPYDVPEILAVQIENGNWDYLSWMSEELAPIK